MTKSSNADCTGTDALLVVTEWREFKILNLEHIKVISDARSRYDPARKERRGFEYYRLGKGKWQKS